MFPVTLSGHEHFKGFLIEARDAAHPDGPAVGNFTLTKPEISQLLTCHNIQVGRIQNIPTLAKDQLHPEGVKPQA